MLETVRSGTTSSLTIVTVPEDGMPIMSWTAASHRQGNGLVRLEQRVIDRHDQDHDTGCSGRNRRGSGTAL
jgi:hypothetical protein